MTQQARTRRDAGGRAVRSDAERTVQTILEAAEGLLSRNPAATMGQIAEAAGVARTTVHRRFASRDALIDALIDLATRQFAAAVDAADPETAPPLVALYQVTANVLRVKMNWGFAMSRATPANPEVARVHADVLERCEQLFVRAQQAGVLRSDADLDWARRVYYTLIDETTRGLDQPAADGTDPDSDAGALATRVTDTLLRGIGTGSTV